MSKRTNTILLTAAVLVGLGLGASVLRGSVPVSEAQTPPQAQTATIPATPPLTPQPLSEKGSKLQNEANTISIVKQYEPGLVYVATASAVSTQQDPFGMGGDGTQQDPTQGQSKPSGIGSGFFVDGSGDILTNYHVVTEGGQSLNNVIKVKVQGQKDPVTASIVGLAPQYDLALIRPKNMPAGLIKPIPLGDSDSLEVGQKTVAMGAPFGFDFSVTEGIVSSTQRQIPIGFSGSGEGITQKAIQTDAAINPGNSGGPLLDSTGRVIGINTQIISPSGSSSGIGQSAGVGFAIPINTAKNLLSRLKTAQGGIVLAPTIGVTAGLIAYQSSFSGVSKVPASVSMLTQEARREYKLPDKGFLVGSVAPGTPAAAAGLKGGHIQQFRGGEIALGGDVIVSADGNPIDSREDLQAAYIAKKPGDTVTLEVENGGKTRQVAVKLDEKSFVTEPLKDAQAQ